MKIMGIFLLKNMHVNNKKNKAKAILAKKYTFHIYYSKILDAILSKLTISHNEKCK